MTKFTRHLSSLKNKINFLSTENPPVLAKVRDIDSDIEVIEENVDEVPSRRRAPKPKKYIDSDSDSEEPGRLMHD